MDRDRSWRGASPGEPVVTRRLLLSYLSLTALVLVLLEVPLGVLVGQRNQLDPVPGGKAVDVHGLWPIHDKMQCPDPGCLNDSC